MVGHPNLKILLPFQGDLLDRSGNANNGTNVNTAKTYSTAPIGSGVSIVNSTSTTSGTANAVRFVNTTSLNPATGNYTLAMRLKCTDTRGDDLSVVFVKYGASTNNNLMVRYDASYKLFISTRDTNGIEIILTDSAQAINDGVWRHYAFARIGTTVYMYVNGVLKQTAANAALASINLDGTAYYWLGCYSTSQVAGIPNQGASCYVDDLQYYVGVGLPDSDIKRIVLGLQPLTKSA